MFTLNPLASGSLQDASNRDAESLVVKKRSRLNAHTKAIPVLLDLVSDRVQSRSLTTLIFCIVLLFVARSTVAKWFLVPLANSNDTSCAFLTVQLGNSSWSSLKTGLQSLPPVLVQAKSPIERPVPNLMISAILVPKSGLEFAETARTLHSTISLQGIPQYSRYSIPGFVPSRFRHPTLVGHELFTEKDGSVTFTSMKLFGGIPGQYDLFFTAGGVESEAIPVSITSSVAKVEIVGCGTFGKTGIPLSPPPNVVVMDSAGQRLKSGHTVLAHAPGLQKEEVMVPMLLKPPGKPNVALLSGDSAVTGEDGVAVFASLAITAHSTPSVKIVFFCDGVVSEPVFIEMEMAEPLFVEIATQPSDVVIEGLPFNVSPSIKVSAKGLPVGGHVAFAFLCQFRGVLTDFCVDPLERDILTADLGSSSQLKLGKHVQRFISLPSNSSTGIASFLNMSISVGGSVGSFRILFAVAGRWSALSSLIRVESSVARVEILQPLASNATFLFSGPFSWGSLVFSAMDVSGELSGGAIQISDANGLPIQAKPFFVQAIPCDRRGDTWTTEGDIAGYVVREFTEPGKSTSDWGGEIRLESYAAFQRYYNVETQYTDYKSSFLRVLVAPHVGNADICLRFVVEGVASAWMDPIVVTNAVPLHDLTCASLDIISPAGSSVKLLERASSGVIVAKNAHGLPIPGLLVESAVTAAFGPLQVGYGGRYYLYIAQAFQLFFGYLHFALPDFFQGGYINILGPSSETNSTGMAEVLSPLVLAGWNSFMGLTYISKQEYTPTACSCAVSGAECALQLGCAAHAAILCAGCAGCPSTVPDSAPKSCMATEVSRCISAVTDCTIVAESGPGWRFESPGLCSSLPFQQAIQSSVHVDVVSTPTICSVGTPMGKEFVFRVTNNQGDGISGQRVLMMFLVDSQFHDFPSYIIWPEFLSSAGSDMPVLTDNTPFIALWDYDEEMCVNCSAFTDTQGYARMTVTLRRGYPGKYRFFATSLGESSDVTPELSCPVPVTSVEPVSTGVLSPGMCPKPVQSLNCTIPPCPCVPSTVTSTDNTSVLCSGNGTCACGVCVCNAGLGGDGSCGTPFVEDGQTLPVLHVQQEVPAVLLGRIQLKVGDGGSLAGFRVGLSAVDCKSGERLPAQTISVHYSQCALERAQGYPFSNPSVEDGACDFTYIPKVTPQVEGAGTTPSTSGIYISRAKSGCYAFRYSFASNSSGSLFTSQVSDLWQGAVVSSNIVKFRLINPVESVAVVVAPSPVAAPGVVLPPVVIRVRGRNLDLLPQMCRPSVRLSAALAQPVYPCPDGEGVIVRVFAVSGSTGEVVRLFDPGSTSDCARVNSTGFAVFTELRFPQLIANENFDVFTPLQPGLYRLVFDVLGVVSEDLVVVKVRGSPEVLNLVDTPLVVGATVGKVVPIISVEAKLSTGDRMPGVQVLASLPSGSTAKLRNAVATTNSSGIALFDALLVVEGDSGRLQVVFSAAKASVAVTVSLENEVESVLLQIDSTAEEIHAVSSMKIESALKVTLKQSRNISRVLVPKLFAAPSTGPCRWLSTWRKFPAGCLQLQPVPGLSITFPTLVTDDTGVASVRSFALLNAPASQRVYLVLFADGVPSNPLRLAVTKFEDHNKFEVSQLSNIVWIPAILMIPLFAANTLFIRRQYRPLALASGILSILSLLLAILLVFYPETRDLETYFEPAGILYVTITNWALLALTGVAALFLVWISYRHFTSKASKSADHGFFLEKTQAHASHTRSALPRWSAPLWEGGGALG